MPLNFSSNPTVAMYGRMMTILCCVNNTNGINVPSIDHVDAFMFQCETKIIFNLSELGAIFLFMSISCVFFHSCHVYNVPNGQNKGKAKGKCLFPFLLLIFIDIFHVYTFSFSIY